jgi:hypothetical protein
MHMPELYPEPSNLNPKTVPRSREGKEFDRLDKTWMKIMSPLFFIPSLI